jgi:DNA repair ATPase RecN
MSIFAIAHSPQIAARATLRGYVDGTAPALIQIKVRRLIEI